MTDNFYGKIHIANDHMRAFLDSFSNPGGVEISLIEEMSELTKAITKEYRNIDPDDDEALIDDITEEMAHVLISLKGLAYVYGIQEIDIQQEIEKKWPTAYGQR